MDFFAEQDKARGKTKKLVLLFCLAVLCIIGCVYALFSLLLLQDPELSKSAWSFQLFAPIALGVILIVGLASLCRIAFLSGGGKVVAESLGGKLIQPNTSEPLEKRILNLVEEMAIASGAPVPPVYLLEEKGINAFAAGYSPADAVVGITRGCAEKLNRDQLQGVIAHEFSHILNGDMRLNIRLSGIIFGIIFLSRVGEIMMRIAFSSRRSRSRNGDGDGTPALILIGLVLFVIGLVGGFFGSLIRAAVSRQREFLADASAVQFTRNPDGISGALKRIGGFSAGSQIKSSLAGDYSHFFFCSALSSLFATHPPLPVRIRKIEPNWSNQYPQTDKISQTIESDSMLASGFASSSVSVSPKDHPSENDPNRSMKDSNASPMPFHESLGGPNQRNLRHAQSMIRRLSPTLLTLAKEPAQCRCIFFALLFDSSNASILDQQAKSVLDLTDQATIDLTIKILPEIRQLDEELKYLLIEECSSTLSLFSEPQIKSFQSLIESLIRADEQIDLFEWSVQKVIQYQISQKATPGAKALHGRTSLKSRLHDCSIFLGAIAHYGGNPENADQAYAKGFQSLERSAVVQLPSVRQCGLAAMEEALSELSKMTPLAKRSFLEACSKVAEHDGVISPPEIQIIRGIAAALSCPLGPIGYPA